MTNFDCCKECVAPKRHVGCHSTCEDYLKCKAKHEEFRKKYVAEREYANERIAYIKQSQERARRRLNRGHYNSKRRCKGEGR